jgi:hypothetical protein
MAAIVVSITPASNTVTLQTQYGIDYDILAIMVANSSKLLMVDKKEREVILSCLTTAALN